MESNKKIKFLQLLYGTEEKRKFMVNDFYQELTELIPFSMCINSKNLTKQVREDNYDKAFNSISKFLTENPDYKKIVKDYYDEHIEYILYGYVFYLANTNDKYKDIDIFKDKRSILYSEISILDIL